jgi:hypothetical protein
MNKFKPLLLLTFFFSIFSTGGFGPVFREPAGTVQELEDEIKKLENEGRENKQELDKLEHLMENYFDAIKKLSNEVKDRPYNPKETSEAKANLLKNHEASISEASESLSKRMIFANQKVEILRKKEILKKVNENFSGKENEPLDESYKSELKKLDSELTNPYHLKKLTDPTIENIKQSFENAVYGIVREDRVNFLSHRFQPTMLEEDEYKLLKQQLSPDESNKDKKIFRRLEKEFKRLRLLIKARDIDEFEEMTKDLFE